MANNFESNTTEKLLKAFTKNFESSTVATQTTSRQLVTDFDASTGGIVKMKRPTKYKPQRSADGDMTGRDTNPISVGSVSAEVGEYITVFTEIKDIERALETDQLDELLKPVAEDMAVELDSEASQRMMVSAALQSGDASKSVSAWADIAGAGATMKAVGVPSGEKYALIDDFSEVDLAEQQSGLGVQSEVGSAWSEATVRRNFAGLDRVLTTNNLPVLVTGAEDAELALTSTPVATYSAYKDTYQMLLSFDGGTGASVLRAGQQLRCTSEKYMVNIRNRKTVMKKGAPLAFTFTVLEDATAAAGAYTNVKVSGAAIFETGVDGAFNTISAALEIGDTFEIVEPADTELRPALAYHKEFFGVGNVKLEPLYGKQSKVINLEKIGLSVRLTMDADTVGNKNLARWDMLPSFCCFNPYLGVRMGGS